jgi:hypothetical protein
MQCLRDEVGPALIFQINLWRKTKNHNFSSLYLCKYFIFLRLSPAQCYLAELYPASIKYLAAWHHALCSVHLLRSQILCLLDGEKWWKILSKYLYLLKFNVKKGDFFPKNGITLGEWHVKNLYFWSKLACRRQITSPAK